MTEPTFLEWMATASARFRGASWDAWRVVLRALSGAPLTAEQLELFRACTGRAEPLAAAPQEAWLIVGRRGGKSIISAGSGAGVLSDVHAVAR